MSSNCGRYAALCCSRVNNGFWTECHLHRYFTTDITWVTLVGLLSPYRLEIYTLVEHVLSISYHNFRNLLTRIYTRALESKYIPHFVFTYCSDLFKLRELCKL